MDKTKTIHMVKKLNVTDLSGEKVMIDFDCGKYFMIKGVGNDIWDMIQNDITVDEVIKKLLAEYDVSEEECATETEEFLQKLAEYDIIEYV